MIDIILKINVIAMDENKYIKNILKPRRDIKASDAFRAKIENEIRKSESSHSRRGWVWGGVTVASVIAAILIMVVPGGIWANDDLSAKKILSEAIATLRKYKSIEIKADIRTDSHEIFEHINPKAEFITHDIMIQQWDSVKYWYINKDMRSAEKNKNGLYVWLSRYNLGWHYGECDNILGYLNTVMNPEKILESEFEYIMSCPEAKYEMSEKNGEIVLTIHSMPKGDYSNPYVLNTSIDDSENIRRYTLDAHSSRLKTAVVSIVMDSKEIEVLKVTDIKYDIDIMELPAIPKHIKFIEDDDILLPQGISGLSAREAASVFLSAFSDWDTDIIYKYLHPEEAEEIFRNIYEGAKLINLGIPFRSGSNEHLMFVPYTLRLKDGEVKKMNLVLADYSGDAWVFDGGL